MNSLVTTPPPFQILILCSYNTDALAIVEVRLFIVESLKYDNAESCLFESFPDRIVNVSANPVIPVSCFRRI